MKKMKKMCRPAHLLLGALIVLGSGCSLIGQHEYYQLQADTVAASSHANTAVLLGPVKLADYLQREQILQRHADGRLTASRGGRWAGSLEDEVGQLLLRQLAARLDSSHVALYPDRIGVKLGAQVILSISRLDSGVEQPAILDAQWRLLDADGKVRDSRVVSLQAEHDGELASQVRAQSALLVQLSEQLAAAVRRMQGGNGRATSQEKNDPAQQPQSTRQEAPQDNGHGNMPVVEPVKELEVYRF